MQQAKFGIRGVAQEQVIWNFQGPPSDGAGSSASLITDSSGALYGTTIFGGDGPNANGTVYKLTPAQSGYSETVLYNFQGSPKDGDWPGAALIADNSGALYGTTGYGGSTSCSPSCGTVFKLSPAGSGYTESILYYFQSGTGGANPAGSLLADSKGALYGTTAGEGAHGYGTAFKLTPTKSGYTETVLHQFEGTTSRSPTSGLVADQGGTLFGETYGGTQQNTNGMVYSLSPTKSGYRYTELYRFRNTNVHDGYEPIGGLLLDATGTLFGTTLFGGTKGCNCGTVFKLTPTGSGYKETTLHIFLGSHANDGSFPHSGVIADTTGALYGTTTGNGPAYGTVFKLTPSGSGYTESILYGFGGSSGVYPYAGLLLDSAGSLYGSTSRGGGAMNGTVFKVTQ
jgi:uncharacterized repeat protein (TIGR03803 family)